MCSLHSWFVPCPGCTLSWCGAQYDWLVREKIADGALISKWRKPGYEILCSMLAIQKGNHNFGTTSHCRSAAPWERACPAHLLAGSEQRTQAVPLLLLPRVPMAVRSGQQRITPDVQTGCIACASGDGKFGAPIWWNTPVEDDDLDGAQGGASQHRAQWAQPGVVRRDAPACMHPDGHVTHARMTRASMHPAWR
jgi:bud site selection protein 31